MSAAAKTKAAPEDGSRVAARGEDLSRFPHRRNPLGLELGGRTISVLDLKEHRQVKPSSFALDVHAAAGIGRRACFPAPAALATDDIVKRVHLDRSLPCVARVGVARQPEGERLAVTRRVNVQHACAAVEVGSHPLVVGVEVVPRFLLGIFPRLDLCVELVGERLGAVTVGIRAEHAKGVLDANYNDESHLKPPCSRNLDKHQSTTPVKSLLRTGERPQALVSQEKP